MEFNNMNKAIVLVFGILIFIIYLVSMVPPKSDDDRRDSLDMPSKIITSNNESYQKSNNKEKNESSRTTESEKKSFHSDNSNKKTNIDSNYQDNGSEVNKEFSGTESTFDTYKNSSNPNQKDEEWEEDWISTTTENNASYDPTYDESSEDKISDLDFDIKLSTLRNAINRIRSTEPNSYYINIHREMILIDSFSQIMNINTIDLKIKKPNIKFVDEHGIDSGGLTKEWLELVTKEALNPDRRYFAFSSEKHTTVRPFINSNINEDHLEFFRFVGRLLGISIINNYNIGANFDRSVYKYILNKKVKFTDIEEMDPEYYRSLIWIRDNSIEGLLEHTFSYELYEFGKVEIVDIIENGREIPVTDKNKQHYIKLMVEFKLAKSIEKQLDAIKDGLFELINSNLLTTFTDLELELLICGNSTIEVNDWMNNTSYINYEESEDAIRWFWEVVNEFTETEKAKLLQFVTGTSRVPLGGFANLRGTFDDDPKFTIRRWTFDVSELPVGHTCINTFDLPAYPEKEILKNKILYAINEGSEGFELS